MRGSSGGDHTAREAICRFSVLVALAVSAIFSMAQSAAAAKLTVLYSFCSVNYCTDGSLPMGTPAIDAAGNIYGTTQGTGSYYQNPYGTVFKISPSNVFTRLDQFCAWSGCADGFYPQSDITLDAKGNLYGTASMGGTHEKGTVFKVSPSGTLTVLHSFCSNNVASVCVDGSQPVGSVILDNTGIVYGLTDSGGKQNEGLLYKIDPTTSVLSYVYGFCASASCTDGYYPDGRLLNDGKGNLYGVTYYGGTYGYGTLFKVSMATRRITTLYSFCRLSGCPDGGYPRGGLVMDKAGNIYGVTSYGGGSTASGVLYKVTPTKAYTVLRKFCTLSFCTDGQRPNGGLAISATGIIYGTTNAGGNTSGQGVLFHYDTVKKAYGLTYSFCSQPSCTDGGRPATDAGVVIDKAGNLYGTTTYGGKTNQGVVYKIVP